MTLEQWLKENDVEPYLERVKVGVAWDVACVEVIFDPELRDLSDKSAKVSTEIWRANLHTEEKMGTGL